MKVLLKAIALFAICSLLQACSYFSDIVLVNESDTAIDVEYQMPLVPASVENPALPDSNIPKTMSFGKWDGSYRQDDWKPLAGGDYRVDLATGKFKLRLPPRTAVKFRDVSDSVFYGGGDGKDFPLKRIEVRGLYGNLSYEGIQVYQQFVQKKDAKRYISYK